MRQLRAEVDAEKCFSFGRCMETAPRVFDWDESGIAVGGLVPEGDYDVAKKAAESCPRLAITLIETEEDEPTRDNQ